MRPLQRDQSLLVRLPDWLGDVVAVEPVLNALEEWRTREPLSAQMTRPTIGLWGADRWLTLFQDRFPHFRRVSTSVGDRLGEWDVALLLTGSFRSAWLARKAGIRRRVGWARDGRRFLLTDAWRPAREGGATPWGLGRAGNWPRILPRPVGDSATELVSALGVTVRRRRPLLMADKRARSQVNGKLAQLGISEEPLVLVNVGARAGSTKGWSAKAWAKAVRALAESAGDTGVPAGGAEPSSELSSVHPIPMHRIPKLGRVLLISGPGEAAALGRAKQTFADLSNASVPSTQSVAVWPDPAPSLSELVALCERAQLFLGADTGARHIASAVQSGRNPYASVSASSSNSGPDQVIVFGPTDPRHTSADLSRTLGWRTQVACGPCHAEPCPLASAHSRSATSTDPPDLRPESGPESQVEDTPHCMQLLDPVEFGRGVADWLGVRSQSAKALR